MLVTDCVRDFDLYDGKYGIEIEVEGSNLQIPANTKWKMVEDGSLRHNPECCEYVFKKPLSYVDALDAISWLNNKHEDNESELNWSFRCSTHVHVNVQKWSVSKLLRFIYYYYLFENCLVKWSGKEREGNRFCLRIQDSYHISNIISDAFLSNLREIPQNHVRYSALNLGSLPKYGSIEFRSLEGTTSRVRIQKWLDFIECLEEAADSGVSIAMTLENLRVSSENVAKAVFGDSFEELRYEDWESDTLYNASLNISMVELEREVLRNEEDFDIRLQQQQQKRKAAEEQAERKAAEARKQQMEAEAQQAANQLGQQPVPAPEPQPVKRRPAVRKQAAVPQAPAYEQFDFQALLDYRKAPRIEDPF